MVVPLTIAELVDVVEDSTFIVDVFKPGNLTTTPDETYNFSANPTFFTKFGTGQYAFKRSTTSADPTGNWNIFFEFFVGLNDFTANDVVRIVAPIEESVPTYTTSALVSAYLGKTYTTSTTPTSDQIDMWITEVEKMIDEEIGTSYKINNIIEFYDYNQYTSYISPEGLAFAGNVGRRDYLPGVLFNDQFVTKHRPIITINSLKINESDAASSDVFTTITEQTGSGGNYVSDKNTGVITFLNKFPRFGKRSIKIDYDWGRSLVPKHIQKLATLLVAKVVLSSVASSTQTENIDSINIGDISISKGVTQSVSFRESLEKEIQSLWDIVGRFEVDAI